MKIVVEPLPDGTYLWPQGTWYIDTAITLPVDATEPFEVEVLWGVPA